ncbi:capsular polysaccharide export protein, LipB/KpsS family [Ectopseudomonas hydrolytica]|uniref:capsular polysaccharide export protein, LipB/KpsS family n=1 Tax=Ectopseudomonas hydrolytica TaxID=2493633 RepID=UPI00376F0730
MSSETVEKKTETPRVVVFGFPFSDKRKSPFTGGKEGPLVVSSFIVGVGSEVLLISRSATSYVDLEGVYPIQQILMFQGSGHSIASLGVDDLSRYSDVEILASEMLGRNNGQLRMEVGAGCIESYDMRRNAVRNKIAYWLDLVRSRNIVGWVNSNAPHFVDDYICYEICRRHGLPTVFPYRLPIVPGVSARLYLPLGLFDHGAVYLEDGRVVRAEDIDEALIQQPLPEDLELIYNEVVLGGKSLGELSREALSSMALESPAQYLHQPNWLSGLRSRLKAWWTGDSSLFKLHQAWRRRADENRKDYRQLSTEAVPQGNYLYFPLHMQPEASSCPLGGLFSDQLRAIRLLAEALPAGWQLVVKEHPLQKMEIRPAGWYRDLVKSPNVVLVAQHISSAELQKGARAVATLTGAAAWEAWLWRKPALVLGHILYQEAPGIYKVRSRQDAQHALGKIAAGVVHDQADIRRYLGCLAHMTFIGHLDAYINPCLPPYQLDPEDNERTIGRRLAAAYRAQQNNLHEATRAESLAHA